MVKTRAQLQHDLKGGPPLHEVQGTLTKSNGQQNGKGTLMDLVQAGRGRKKRSKMASLQDADEVEFHKDPKITKFLLTPYVEPSKKKEKKKKMVKHEGLNLDLKTQHNGEAKKEVNSIGLRDPIVSGVGRGRCINETKKDMSHKDGPAGVSREERHMVSSPGGNIGLHKSTTDQEICTWPLQALAQLALKIESDEYPIEKEYVTKCCPKVLRSLMMQFRDDLVLHNKDVQVETKVKKSAGVFGIETKEWEIESYDRDDLEGILRGYMDIEQIIDERQEISDLSANDIRSYLYQFQDMMMDAEVVPFNVHAKFESFKGDLAEALTKFNQKMEVQSQEGAQITQSLACETNERERTHSSDTSALIEDSIEEVQAVHFKGGNNTSQGYIMADLNKERDNNTDGVQSDSDEEDSMTSYVRDEEEGYQRDHVSVGKDGKAKYCHILSRDTHDMVIAGWSAKVLLQVIRSRSKTYELFLPFHLLKQCNPKILRRIVRDIRDELQEQQNNDVYESRLSVNSSLFNAEIAKWELKAYDIGDLKIIYSKFVEMSKIPDVSDGQQWTKEKYVKYLLKIRKKMRQKGNTTFQVHVKLECFEGNVEKAMAKLVHAHDKSDRNDYLLLTPSSSDDKINQWSPGVLKQFIHIWNVKEKLKLRIHDMEILPANILRGIVHQIRDELDIEGRNDSIHVESEYWATVHPQTKQWEIESYTWKEQKVLLCLVAEKINKSYEVDDMSRDECVSCVMELIASKAFQNGKFTIFKRMEPQRPVQQADINKFFRPNQKADQVIIHLNKDSCRDDIRKWSSKVLVEMIRQIRPKMRPKEKFTLSREKVTHLREIVLTHLQDLQEHQKNLSYTSKDLRQGFFGQLTMDWEIQGYTQVELQDLLRQLRSYLKTKVPRSQDESLEALKQELQKMRDILRENDDNIYFNIQKLPGMSKRSLNNLSKSDDSVNDEVVSSERSELDGFKKDGIRAYSEYSKQQLIKKYSTLFSDVEDASQATSRDCIPCLTRETEDVSVGMWPPKIRMEILQQAGVEYQGQDAMELFQSLRNLRNSMTPGKEIRAYNPFYGFFGRSTKDSTLRSLSEIDIKRLYITHCKRHGVVLALQFLDGVVQQDILEELQLIRALWHHKKYYRFDLCIQLIHGGNTNMDQKSVKDVYTQIARRLKAGEVQRDSLFDGKKKSKLHHVGNNNNDNMQPEHIMGLTAEWEIKNMSREEAIVELNYQCDLLQKEMIPVERMDGMQKEEIISKLLEFRKIHARIYRALNLSADDAKTQEDLVDDESTSKEMDTSDTEPQVTEVSMTEVKNGSSLEKAQVVTGSEEQESGKIEVTAKEHTHVITQMDEVADGNDDQCIHAIDTEKKGDDERNLVTDEPTMDVDVQQTEIETSADDLDTTMGNAKETHMKDSMEIESNEEKPNSNLFLASTSQVKSQMDTSTGSTNDKPESSFCYLRARMQVNSRSAHVPSLLKKLVRVLRENDPSLQILPFDLNSVLSSDTIIVHEDQFPDKEEYIREWVRGIVINRTQKLCFSLRITTKKSFRKLKDDIYETLNQQQWWVNFDDVRSESVFLVGWLKGIHPRGHSKELVKKFIEEQLPRFKYKFHLYYRTVWEKDGNDEEVGTEALALESAFQVRNQVMDAISKLHWNVQYGEVLLVPMRTSRECTLEHKLSAFGQQNTYLKNTHTKSVLLKRNCVLEKRNGYPVFFEDWIVRKTVNNVRFLQKAETYSNNSVKLIYHKDFEYMVEEVVANLFQNVCKDFSMSMAVQLLGPEEAHSKKLASFNKTANHHKKCAEAIEQSRVKVTPMKKIGQKANRHGSSGTTQLSYAAVTQPQSIPSTPQKSDHSQELEKSMERKFENRMKEIEAMVAQKGFDENKITAKFQASLQLEINKTRKVIESKMKQDKEETMDEIKNSEHRMATKMDEKGGIFTDQLKAITNMLWETKAETEAQSSSVDRMEQNQSKILDALDRLTNISQPQNTPITPISAVERGSCHGGVR